MEETSLRQKTKKGLYWSFFNQFANYAMQFVVGIIMARLLTPSDYGITAIPVIFMTIANVFIESGFSSALVRKEELTEKDLTTSFLYSFAVGIFCYLCLFISAPWIASFYNTPILKPLIRITALTFLWAPLNTPQNVILQRKLDFKTPARISIVNKIISAILGITAAYLGYGLWALVIANLSSSILGLIQTWLAVKWLPREGWSRDSFKYLWGYGNKVVASQLIETLFSNIAPFLIGKYGGGTVDLGNYDRAKGYAAMPSSNVAGVLSSVTFPVLSKMQDDDARLGVNYRKMIRVSAFLLFPMMLLLAALARPLVLVMLTAKWEACIILLQLLCFTFMWQPVQLLNVNLLYVKGRTDLALRLRMIIKPIGVIVTIPALLFGGIIWFCVAQIMMQIIALTMNTYYTGKLIKVGFLMQMKDIIPFLILSLLMFAIILVINTFFSSLYLQILLGASFGVLFYCGISYLFKFEELDEVKYLLKIKK
jgi:O-antigen/teichoic acid export membrane protein